MKLDIFTQWVQKLGSSASLAAVSMHRKTKPPRILDRLYMPMPLSGNAVQRLRQIGDNIAMKLNPHREADQSVGHSGGQALLFF